MMGIIPRGALQAELERTIYFRHAGGRLVLPCPRKPLVQPIHALVSQAGPSQLAGLLT